MYRAMYAYAWDVIEQGLGETAAHLRRLGLDTLTLASSYHAGKFIRPRGRTSKVVFPEDGTVYFRPRMERYGRIKPRLNTLLDAVDPFAAWPGDSGVRLNAWTVLLHNTPLGYANPDCVARNAFGDPYWYSLCPNHPDVRAYAVALCADLGDRPAVSGLSLETPGFLPYAHGYHHEFAQVRGNPWLETMLGLCFCDRCVAGAEAAGAPAGTLKQRVAGLVSDYLASDITPAADMARDWLAADLVADPHLAAFLRWRCERVTELVAEIRAAVRRDVTLAVIPSIQRPSAIGWGEGSDLAGLGRVADRLEIPLYEPTPDRAVGDLWDVRRRAEGAALRCILRPGPPDMETAGQLAATVAALAERGVGEIAFYNYGLLRPHNLDWIAAALAQLGDPGQNR